MKQIIAPPPVTLLDHEDRRMKDVDGNGQVVDAPPVTFAAWVIRQWLETPVFKDVEGITMLRPLVKKLRAVEGGGPINLENEEHRRLEKAVKNYRYPQNGVVPNFALAQLDVFAEAILNAKNVDVVVTETTPVNRRE